jgi:hypothetical protein
MIGLGLGGGAADQALTLVGLLGVDDVVRDAERMVRAFNMVDAAQEKASRSGAMLQRIGFSMTALSGSAIALGLASTSMANDVIESENVVDVAFGKSRDTIDVWSKDLRKSLGLNEYALRNNAAVFKMMLESLKFDDGTSSQMSRRLTMLAEDMTSLFNIPNSKQSFMELRSALAGESEVVRKYGIDISDATVSSYAAQHGIKALHGELSQAQKVQIRYNLLLEQTTKAQGDLARTSDQPRNRQRRLASARDMEMVELGKALQPIQDDVIKIANDILPIVSKFVGYFADLNDSTRKWVVGLGMAVGPVTWLAGKLYPFAKGLKDLLPGSKNIADATSGGSGVGGERYVATMNVRAAVVNLYGARINGGGRGRGGRGGAAGVAEDIADTIFSTVVLPRNVAGALSGGAAAAALTGSNAALAGGAGAGIFALPGAVAGAGGAAAGAAASGGNFGALRGFMYAWRQRGLLGALDLLKLDLLDSLKALNLRSPFGAKSFLGLGGELAGASTAALAGTTAAGLLVGGGAGYGLYKSGQHFGLIDKEQSFSNRMATGAGRIMGWMGQIGGDDSSDYDKNAQSGIGQNMYGADIERYQKELAEVAAKGKWTHEQHEIAWYKTRINIEKHWQNQFVAQGDMENASKHATAWVNLVKKRDSVVEYGTVKWLDSQKGKLGVIGPRRGETDMVEEVWDKRTKEIGKLFGLGPEAEGTRKMQGSGRRTRDGGAEITIPIPAGAGDIGARNTEFLLNTPNRMNW